MHPFRTHLRPRRPQVRQDRCTYAEGPAEVRSKHVATSTIPVSVLRRARPTQAPVAVWKVSTSSSGSSTRPVSNLPDTVSGVAGSVPIQVGLVREFDLHPNQCAGWMGARRSAPPIQSPQPGSGYFVLFPEPSGSRGIQLPGLPGDDVEVFELGSARHP